MKTPRASTGILSSENDDFEFLKPAKDIKKQVHHVHHRSRAHGNIYHSKPVDHKCKNSYISVLYIFQSIEI